jgi:nitroreductase
VATGGDAVKNREDEAVDFAHVVRKRFMCRSFKDRDVPDEVLDRIIHLAVRFPSAGNTQPQEFIVIRSEDTKRKLARAALHQLFLAEAPVVIVVVSDTRRSKAGYGARGEKFYSIIDGAFAALLLILAAVNEGLGAAFVGAFEDDAVRAVLGLPRAVRPIGIIPIGVCAEPPAKVARFSKEEIVHYERWDDRGL